MIFFVGLHHPGDAINFDNAFVSVNRIAYRKSKIKVNKAVIDSGAFSTIAKYGGYPDKPKAYADIVKFHAQRGVLAAVTQDYMCEPHMLKKTGMDIPVHQQLTVERYDDLLQCDMGGTYLLPVLQGYEIDDYVRHLAMYGYRIGHGAWVGVGSICKRNGDPKAIEDVLFNIKKYRPDLRLHGFGIKITALGSTVVRSLLHSADSMAWSFAARRSDQPWLANDWKEAKRFEERILKLTLDRSILISEYAAAEGRWLARST